MKDQNGSKIFGKIHVLGYSKDGRFARFNLMVHKPKSFCIAIGFYNFDLGVTYIKATARYGRKYGEKYIEISKQILKSNDWDSTVYTYGSRRISREAFNRVWDVCVY